MKAINYKMIKLNTFVYSSKETLKETSNYPEPVLRP